MTKGLKPWISTIEIARMTKVWPLNHHTNGQGPKVVALHCAYMATLLENFGAVATTSQVPFFQPTETPSRGRQRPSICMIPFLFYNQ